MREIKFRAWDNRVKKMINDFLVVQCNQDFPLTIEQKRDSADVIMQFTGLVDKNGAEIYEGDILEITFDNLDRSYRKEVKWLSDKINKGRWDALDNCAFTSCEVIGNIYEHSELLTNKGEERNKIRIFELLNKNATNFNKS